jgi:hypothetical protein
LFFLEALIQGIIFLNFLDEIVDLVLRNERDGTSTPPSTLNERDSKSLPR